MERQDPTSPLALVYKMKSQQMTQSVKKTKRKSESFQLTLKLLENMPKSTNINFEVTSKGT